MAQGTGPERIQRLVDTLRKWQALERDALETTSEIMESTDNKLIWQVMEIIRNDSVQHHRVQRFIIDSLTKEPVRLSAEEMAEVWGRIEEHDKLERETIELAKQLLEETTDPVAKLLLNYLLRDEEKHDMLLGELDELKKHMAKLA